MARHILTLPEGVCTFTAEGGVVLHEDWRISLLLNEDGSVTWELRSTDGGVLEPVKQEALRQDTSLFGDRCHRSHVHPAHKWIQSRELKECPGVAIA